MKENIIDDHSEELWKIFDILHDGELPENIIEMEKIVGDAYLEGVIDIALAPQKETIKKIEALLMSKNVMPVPACDFGELAQKIYGRFVLGKQSWDFGLADELEENLAKYKRLKNRPSVKKLVDKCGLNGEVFLIINHIDAIDKEVAKGKTFNDIYHSIIYVDDVTSNHALLNYLEEHFNTEIKSQKQLVELAKINYGTYEDYVKDFKKDMNDDKDLMSKEDFNKANDGIDCCYYMALSSRYSLELEKILSNGGKYKDLLDVNYKAFGFPDEFKYQYNLVTNVDKDKSLVRDTSQKGFIRKAIFSHFHLGETAIKRVPLREVANLIEAPYGEVLKASRIYD